MNLQSLRVAASAAPVREMVLGNLREAIFNRTFAPGQRLIERELCELTGVSRTSVREALRQLETEGLVKIVPHRGPIVASVSAEEAAELYELRGVLEALAAKLFTERATDDEVAALAMAVDRIQEADRVDGTSMLQAKNHFYDVLLGGARNSMIIWVLGSLHARVTYLRATSLQRPERHAESIKELRAIINAIQNRDANAAWNAGLYHVQQAAAVALDVLKEEAEAVPVAE